MARNMCYGDRQWRFFIGIIATCLIVALFQVSMMGNEQEAGGDYDVMSSRRMRRAIQEEVEQQVNRINAKPKDTYPEVAYLPADKRKRILVTGGAGFVGSHLVDRLMIQGHEVTVVDNFFTGRKKNVEHWLGHPNFDLLNHDVTLPLYLQVDEIYHLASPASPPHYMLNPIYTLKTNVVGTLNMLGLARRVRARFLLTSTSEVYGDPKVHPQHESYWGNVNTLGPRSCYDEGKRAAETMCLSYFKQEGVDVRIARIFNTFGPRMHPNDGRVVSNFIIQALKGIPVTVYGTGEQTRSFQYVDDLVAGLMALMASNATCTPVNLGNPDEFTINSFTKFIQDLVQSNVPVTHLPANQDDPQKRKPDISRARALLDWSPRVPVKAGIKATIDYFRREIEGTPYVGVFPHLRETYDEAGVSL